MVRQSEIQYAMCCFLKKFKEYEQVEVKVETFCDGWAFATILRQATHFKLSMNDLIENPETWTFKLNNLKKVVNAIEEYFDSQIKKIIKTKDIDLVEISKNCNTSQISKFFEVVIAVMTQSPNKEDHIGIIMSLDERSQTIFVEIIQNLLQSRVSQINQQGASVIALQLQNQNEQLRSQVENLLAQNTQLQKTIHQLRLKNEDLQQELDKNLKDNIGVQHKGNHQQIKQKQHLRLMVENLKDKLFFSVRQSQQKIALMREQMASQQNKIMKFDQIQQQLKVYKKKYAETIEAYGKAKLWEKQRIKLKRMIDERDQSIRKLQEKLQQVNQLNFSMQEKEVYMKMQIQKRDVRFKQLEKQVKKKLQNSAPTSITQNSANSALLSQQISDIDYQELEQLRIQSDKNKKKTRQLERENKKLKRNLQKISILETQKKKLERLIIDANHDRIDQINLLIEALHDMFTQNKKLTDLINQKQ